MMLSGQLEEGHRTQIKSDELVLANAGTTYFSFFSNSLVATKRAIKRANEKAANHSTRSQNEYPPERT